MECVSTIRVSASLTARRIATRISGTGTFGITEARTEAAHIIMATRDTRRVFP